MQDIPIIDTIGLRNLQWSDLKIEFNATVKGAAQARLQPTSSDKKIVLNSFINARHSPR